MLLRVQWGDLSTVSEVAYGAIASAMSDIQLFHGHLPRAIELIHEAAEIHRHDEDNTDAFDLDIADLALLVAMEGHLEQAVRLAMSVDAQHSGPAALMASADNTPDWRVQPWALASETLLSDNGCGFHVTDHLDQRFMRVEMPKVTRIEVSEFS